MGTRGAAIEHWAAQTLRARGLRATVGRCCVLAALADGRHLAVATIAALVRQQVTLAPHDLPRVLDDLRAAGLLVAVPLPDGPVWSLRRPGAEPHSHTLCRACGQVSDLPASALAAAAQQLRREGDFEIDAAATIIVGLCARCHPTAR